MGTTWTGIVPELLGAVVLLVAVGSVMGTALRWPTTRVLLASPGLGGC